MTNDIAFSLINLPPATDAGNYHDDTIQFCRLFENADAFEFCSAVDSLAYSDSKSSPSVAKPEKAASYSSSTMPEPAKCAAPSARARPNQVESAPQQQHEEEDSKTRFKPFHEERWDQKLLELRTFRKRHGHSLVPHTYPPNPQLARWVKRQRRQYKLMQDGKASTMTPDRVEILEQDGFVWDSHEAAWREKIEDLRQYRAKHGHCLVPSNYRENPQLATWVKCQRRQYKLYWESKPSAMNPTRIAELESEGFRWELRNNAGAPAAAPPTPIVAKSAGACIDHQSPTKQVENMNQSELKVLHDIICML